MADGGAREAFEWWRFDEVRADLRSFVEDEIIPLYDSFDVAHGRAHARRVMARAMLLAVTMDVDPEMVFVAAAMHDVGLGVGRAEHHLESARIIRSDRRLARWFSEKEIEVIAQAAADHRASASEPPHTIYGCIVAEADRDIEPETIVWRTVRYGLDHYPHLDREQHWQRALTHLKEKYGRGGYLQLWLPTSPNAEPLDELRRLIDDEHSLRLLFNSFMP
ncbi:MAG: HD domain-containing protein [Bacteroidales bacterium]|nr:HD domain-containing protein [Bacteroidales bacterium]MBR1850698.1 HD domain-containing protein [Bacteroidales bacterium]